MTISSDDFVMDTQMERQACFKQNLPITVGSRTSCLYGEQLCQIMVNVLKFPTPKFLIKWHYANSADLEFHSATSGAVLSGFHSAIK